MFRAMPARVLILAPFVVLLVAAGGFAQPVANPALVNPKMNPVTKVVRLLEEMKATAEKEAADDQEMFENYDCWCLTNEKEKTAAIKAAQEKIEQLTALIEEGAATIAELETAIARLKEDIAANVEGLDKAAAIRAKEREEYELETGDMSEALKMLKEAIIVLKKVQLLQNKAPEKAGPMLVQVQATINHLTTKYKSIMQKDLWDLMGSVRLEAEDAPAMQHTALSQAKVLRGKAGSVSAFQAAPIPGGGGVPGAKSYNSRSGVIFGVLTQMRDEFAKNLADAQMEETQALIAYHNLKAAKEAEIEAAQTNVEQKTAESADTAAKVANAKQDLEDTQNAMSADQKFLIDLKEKCQVGRDEYATRVQTRTEEIRAIGETIKILTEDEARDLAHKTMGLFFLQVDGRVASRRQTKARFAAAKRIALIAKKHRNWVLASLAVTAQLDSFTKVKKAMDDMVVELKKQQAEEVKKHEWCKAELDQNEDTTKEKERTKGKLEATIEDLTGTIETLTTDIAALKTKVAETQVQLKRAGEDRAKENKEFQTVVADQRAMAAILGKAMARLQMFYGGGPTTAPAFAQVRDHQEPGAPSSPPPPSGLNYQKSGGAGGVLQTIQMIIEEAKRNEEEAVHDEQAQQSAYASFVTETNEVLTQALTEINNKSEAKAKADEAKEEAVQDLKTTLADLQTLGEYNGSLHADCDYILKNFRARQEARLQEIEAIGEAKAILSGANFGGKEQEE